MSQSEATELHQTSTRGNQPPLPNQTSLINDDIQPNIHNPWTPEDHQRLSVLLGSALSQLPIWGFAMSYGVLQQFLLTSPSTPLTGPPSLLTIIGTTQNGLMYLLMPPLFLLLTTPPLLHHRRHCALLGVLLATLSFALSSLCTSTPQLVLTLGVLSALGCALIFSPLTLSLGEWFSNPQTRLCNRAVAYGICLSAKNVVGASCPFLFRALLDHLGFQPTLLIWSAILAGTAALSITLIPTHPSILSSTHSRARIPWSFLRHRTFYIYALATLLQSAGYGIPQTYLTSYARDISALPTTFATLLIALINIPGIAASAFFAFLASNRHFALGAASVTAISAVASAIATWVFWGLAKGDGREEAGIEAEAMLTLFAIAFGFFASGYSATWGGVVNEMEREARGRNERVDSGVLYGLLNGARGLGYVSGGLVSVPLMGRGSGVGGLGYGTDYGALIVFTGVALAAGGWGILWEGAGAVREMYRRR